MSVAVNKVKKVRCACVAIKEWRGIQSTESGTTLILLQPPLQTQREEDPRSFLTNSTLSFIFLGLHVPDSSSEIRQMRL
ncbi:hypothetical protein RIF29_17458 [Crotalaria pallida]|uniref:Uncharacterized protein n=1 Tax=Crotalaria pallida TaxID=3830 RepID=A0AAN9FIE5_CROPI